MCVGSLVGEGGLSGILDLGLCHLQGQEATEGVPSSVPTLSSEKNPNTEFWLLPLA